MMYGHVVRRTPPYKGKQRDRMPYYVLQYLVYRAIPVRRCIL